MEAVYNYKSNMPGYVFKRVLVTVVIIIALSMFLFFFTRITGGEYLEYTIATEGRIIDPDPNQMDLFYEWLEQRKEIYHLNEPLIFQYGHWMGGFLTGDWGESYISYSGYPK